MSKATEPNLNEMIAGDGAHLSMPPAFVFVNPKSARKYKKANQDKVDGRTKGARQMLSRITNRKKMKEELEKQTISVSITKDLQFYINENQVDENKIEKELKLIVNNEKEPAIILHTDKSISIEHVVKIMDIAYRNKYKIVLATNQY